MSCGRRYESVYIYKTRLTSEWPAVLGDVLPRDRGWWKDERESESEDGGVEGRSPNSEDFMREKIENGSRRQREGSHRIVFFRRLLSSDVPRGR